MLMEFCVLSKSEWVPSGGRETAYLKIDLWNDYSYITMFHLSLHDKNGVFHDIGDIKIGFKGQTTDVSTYSTLPKKFPCLGEGFFSLGVGGEFSKTMARLPGSIGESVLRSLRDIAVEPDIIESIKGEDGRMQVLSATPSMH
ncbi:hypothetical protein [Halomonas smyrnensis]|uniref:hypothetical protein n=1 Tax=Halomonas smyrnensis TaxID=720605 RepID=UPI0012E9A52A|nr:hypothetical protein [Halomonas smyrnensis]